MKKNDTNLTKEQKQAVGLLSIGTFLEYFDLMLYVHMAVLLNGLFFSTNDSLSGRLLSAFSFSTTFLFRPIGAMLIGYLGDKYGRKSTIVITTSLMSVCCVIMANLPTYDQIGIWASVLVTACRALQGISSMGEAVGAEIYITELIPPPKVYSACSVAYVFMAMGVSSALFVSNLSLSHYLNWRMAFWIGAIIALVGVVARTSLRETPDFADAKRELHQLLANLKISKTKLNACLIYTEKVNKKTTMALFCIQLMTPVYMHFVYIHCANILRSTVKYSAEEVVQHNFIISIMHFLSILLITYLVSFIHPLKILKTKFYVICLFFLACPFLLNATSTGSELMLIQTFLIFFVPSEFPGVPIFYKAFPVFKRFGSVLMIFAISRAVMYTVSSFGLVFLTDKFSNYGLLFLLVPVTICYGYGLSYFIKLEKKNESYPDDKLTSGAVLDEKMV